MLNYSVSKAAVTVMRGKVIVNQPNVIIAFEVPISCSIFLEYTAFSNPCSTLLRKFCPSLFSPHRRAAPNDNSVLQTNRTQLSNIDVIPLVGRQSGTFLPPAHNIESMLCQRVCC
jgi:hypothetical protein